jgi:hypothetical protein
MIRFNKKEAEEPEDTILNPLTGFELAIYTLPRARSAG